MAGPYISSSVRVPPPGNKAIEARTANDLVRDRQAIDRQFILLLASDVCHIAQPRLPLYDIADFLLQWLWQ